MSSWWEAVAAEQLAGDAGLLAGRTLLRLAIETIVRICAVGKVPCSKCSPLPCDPY